MYITNVADRRTTSVDIYEVTVVMVSTDKR
jgi:hypothetical protein